MKTDERKILRDPQADGGGQGWGFPDERVGSAAGVHELVRACGPVDRVRPEQVRRARAVIANGTDGVDARDVAEKLLRELLTDVLS